MSVSSMITDFMIDIETLDTIESAVVLSIGVVAFNHRYQEGGITKEFYCGIGTKDLRDEQIIMGRTVSTDTVQWWKKQSGKAQNVFKNSTHDSVTDALDDLTKFITKSHVTDQPNIWGNGPDFDNQIVSSLYRSYGMTPPWKFFQYRCHRTMKMMHGHIASPLLREGAHHNALDDATHQAKTLMKIVYALQQAKIPHHTDSGL